MPTYLSVPSEDKAKVLALGAKLDSRSGQLFIPGGLSPSLFQSWLPKAPSSELAFPTQAGITLSVLLARCSAAMKAAFPEQLWVRIEIAQIKSSGGHLYISAIERNDAGIEVAKTTAMIWASQVGKLSHKFSSATSLDLAAGLQVLVLAKPVLEARYGLGLHITDIDPNYTLGDMKAKLKKIRDALEDSGDAGKNRALPTPTDFHHVAVISPSQAAGLEDFQAEASRLTEAGLCDFTYFDAFFQGEKTKESLKAAFVSAHHAHDTTPFCALAIIRGGGATADLQWLDEYLIARMVCRFRVPVLTGIGHERDKALIDEYAHRAFGTPSKVIAHICQTIANKALHGLESWSYIAQTGMARLEGASSKADIRKTEIEAGVERRLSHAETYGARHFNAVKSLGSDLVQQASAKADILNNVITGGASSTLNLAAQHTEHCFASLKDLAVARRDAMTLNVEREYEAIRMGATRSMQSAAERVEGQFNTVVDGANGRITTIETTGERDFKDVKFYVRKRLNDGESAARDLMSGIMAHGVAPTLRRGFALVRNSEGPVSNKATAENSSDLQLEFWDGKMKIKKEES